jgi:hypothetical protein
MNANQRKAVYGIALAVIALLVGYNVLAADKAPLWVALVTAVLAAAAPVTALRNITPDDPQE